MHQLDNLSNWIISLPFFPTWILCVLPFWSPCIYSWLIGMNMRLSNNTYLDRLRFLFIIQGMLYSYHDKLGKIRSIKYLSPKPFSFLTPDCTRILSPDSPISSPQCFSGALQALVQTLCRLQVLINYLAPFFCQFQSLIALSFSQPKLFSCSQEFPSSLLILSLFLILSQETLNCFWKAVWDMALGSSPRILNPLAWIMRVSRRLGVFVIYAAALQLDLGHADTQHICLASAKSPDASTEIPRTLAPSAPWTPWGRGSGWKQLEVPPPPGVWPDTDQKWGGGPSSVHHELTQNHQKSASQSPLILEERTTPDPPASLFLGVLDIPYLSSA